MTENVLLGKYLFLDKSVNASKFWHSRIIPIFPYNKKCTIRQKYKIPHVHHAGGPVCGLGSSLVEKNEMIYGGGIELFLLFVVAGIALYFIVFFVLLIFVVLQERTWKAKLSGGGVIVLVFSILPLCFIVGNYIKDRKYKAKVAHRMAGRARYEKLCENAGEFIHRTAANVDGVFLMKLRLSDVYPDDRWAKERKEKDAYKWTEDPFDYWLDPGSGGCNRGFRSGAYIAAFLDSYGYRGTPYAYVDAVDPADGKRYRYTGRIVPEANGYCEKFRLERAEVTPDIPLPRYGVTFADISAYGDRERWWIAGSSLKVIDLETGEVMGERVGYTENIWHDSWGGWGRSGCPYDPDSSRTRRFIMRVLRPTGAEPEPGQDAVAAPRPGARGKN